MKRQRSPLPSVTAATLREVATNTFEQDRANFTIVLLVTFFGKPLRRIS
jgi:hypothetical protein